MIFPGTLEKWNDFDMYVDGENRFVVPHKEADGKPWVWRARFFGVEPQFDIAMLNLGYHVVYCDVSNLYGCPEAVERWNAFYNYLRFEHLFADRAVLEGFSRGGLIAYNWAAENPDKVSVIYADAPVMDFKSWPRGNGTGCGSEADWQQCLEAYNMTEEQALDYRRQPLDKLDMLAEAGIPVIHVVGDLDDVVPVHENTAIAEQRYHELGGVFEVIHKEEVSHHPHSLEDPQPIVEFVLKYDRMKHEMRAEDMVSDKNFVLRGDYGNCRVQFERNKKGHVAFLGGSITEMEGYRPLLCSMLEERFPETDFTFTDAGISSTCSDTGAFRMQQDVLNKGPLDLLFVEFAVNDDQDSDQTYTDALRGMEGIIAQARRHNPCVDIVMTFFVNENMLEKLQNNQTTPAMEAHSKVAEHYGVSVNNLALELAELITDGKMDWKAFGGVHPNKYGNTMCATMIGNALLKSWSEPLSPADHMRPYPLPEPIDPKSYVNGRFLNQNEITFDENWNVGVPDWENISKGAVRPRFIDSELIYTCKANAKLSIDFTGSAIGAYVLSGPESGIINCTIDGSETHEIDTLHVHSNFNYPMTVMFFNDLSSEKHILELEVLENRPGRIKPGGTNLMVLAFAAN
jgi:pimeloyl-ACP methyl ester carboxylesterase/lysophospholipase L1-like esterase